MPDMSIVTKTGDGGDTGLFGGGRVPKDSARVDAYGTVDELNSLLGLAIAAGHVSPEAAKQLTHVQHLLFRLGGDLATPLSKHAKQKRMQPQDAAELEAWIAVMESALPAQTHFVLPGGSPGAALLHVARTVCRRAERLTVKLRHEGDMNPETIVFLNRLSDYLFLLARKTNAEKGVADVKVEYE